MKKDNQYYEITLKKEKNSIKTRLIRKLVFIMNLVDVR